jgi:tRNA 2-thiouridine synthesizing protein A
VTIKWDAGETGCGELVFQLHLRLNRMAPGETIELIALDAGASTDLPAWCRMTGHTLVSGAHPAYVIRKKN